jgi:DNA repair exonuclease SbcCD ATPase subunit
MPGDGLMIFKSISIQNFFSIADRITIQLHNQGLVLIEGTNKDSTALDANGSGKSSIIEAMVWCMYGKTVRGLTADAVVNNKIGKDCEVELICLDNDQEYSIKRYRKHSQFKNGLYFSCGGVDLTDGTTQVTQQKIEDFLGIDFDGFIRGPMMPQGSFKRFSQMTDAEQKQFLENALQLNVLSNAKAKTQEQLAEQERHIQVLDSTLYELRSEQLKVKQNTIRLRKELKEAGTEYVLRKAKQLRSLLAEYQDYEKNLQEYKVASSSAAAKATLSSVRNLAEQARLEYSDKEKKAHDKVIKLTRELDTIQNKVTSLDTEIRRLERQEPDSKCPVCYSLITPAHIAQCSEELYTQRNLLLPKLDVAQEKLKEAKTDHANLILEQNAALKKAAIYIQKAQEAYDTAVREETSQIHIDRAINKFEERMLQRAKEGTLFETNMLWKLINEEVARGQDLDAKVTEMERDYKEHKITVEYLQFWSNGFSNAGMKSKILASVTPFLNKQVSKYIRGLTAGDFTITFNTQTLLKSGESREKFSVDVVNKNGADTYEGSSGGEKARSDLAINFTLSDLVASRSKKSYPQRFFDEPFESIDEAGIEIVMEMLVAMSKTCGTIFVVTHQQTFKSMFNKVLTMVKKNGISTLEAA